MSIVQKIIETVVQFMPDAKPDRLIGKQHGYVGKPFSRVDGQLKVQGAAKFSAEYKLENVAYAALHYSTISKGKIISIDQSAAESADGVLTVITYQNVPKMNAPELLDMGAGGMGGAAASNLPVMRDDQIYWDGQPVAVVVAETQEQAEYAASIIRVEYETAQAAVSFDRLKNAAEVPKAVLGEPPEVEIGDAETALKNADVKIDYIYRTPRHSHNAMEPHATIAFWETDDSLILYEGTQNLSTFKKTLAEVFDLAKDKVRILAPFVGGGFGAKGPMWQNTILCAAAAKVVGRPVKLALSREGVYRLVGGRTPSEQRVALGATKNGKLNALIHSGVTATTTHNHFPEHFTFPARHLYAAENIFLGQKVVNLDMVANFSMRAPGESIGSFALESAIDELAFELKIDPIELRKINEPEKDPTKGTEFSMRNLTEAYRRGAEKFGWKQQEPRSQRDGKWSIGQGMATSYYPAGRAPSSARVRISSDGTAVVSAAAHEMGMGTATVQIQHAAERLGLEIDRVSFQYGDTALPESIVAGGSIQTISVIAAVAAAIEKAHKELLAIAGDDDDSPLANLKYKQIEARDGGLFDREDASKGETYQAILSRIGQEFVEVEATSGMPFESMKYSMHSYGAQFCEVRVNKKQAKCAFRAG
jgi:xanthine dehydrogenase YagR molybdenum-binding subunit